jgi:hypothetical protein
VPANQDSVAFNLKIMDIAERNISTGFDLAMSLAVAKTRLRSWNCSPPMAQATSELTSRVHYA